MQRSLGILAALCVCGATTIAHAQPGNTPPAGPPPPATYVPPPMSPTGPAPATTTVRYGTTIAGVDALAAGLFLVGALVVVGGVVESDQGDEGQIGAGVILMVAGGAVWSFGPAYVHSTKHNNSSAWKSVALRLGLPMLGGMIGSAMTTETCEGGYCYEEDNAASFTGIGMITAMVLDWSVLAKVNVPVQQPAYYPYASATSGGGGVAGIAGAF